MDKKSQWIKAASPTEGITPATASTAVQAGSGAASVAGPGQAAHPLQTWQKREWGLALLLAAALLAAWLPATSGGFIWDDDAYVTGNPLLSAPDGLRRIWFSLESPSQYFPLTYTTFYVERALWGLNPAGYHWVNILLHIASALALWRLLARLNVPGAWLGAALWGLHPVQVESVAWVAERKNVLMGLFFLLALRAWVEFLEAEGKRRRHFYGAALACYVAALFAKATACTMPAALLLILWLKEKPVRRAQWMQIAPFVALGIGMGLLTVWWERYHQFTQGPEFSIGPVERVLIAARAVWFYAFKLIWPAKLTFSYPRWHVSAADPLFYAWPLALAGACAAVCLLRKHAGRGVEVAAAFFVATLSPVLGFIMLYTFRYTFVADHYQYLACIGPLALAAAGIARGCEYFERESIWLRALAAGLLAGLGLLTRQQCGVYENMETLWKTTIARNPESWMACVHIGLGLYNQGRFEEAALYYRKALQSNPDDEMARYDLGNVLFTQGRTEEAISQYREALRIDPAFPPARINLGNALNQLGRTEEAIAQFRAALRVNPDNAEACYDLGIVLVQHGRAEEAIAQFHAALRINPAFALAHNNLAFALSQQGRTEEAIAQYREAIRLNPAIPMYHNNLAAILAGQGRTDDALLEYQKALDLQPGNVDYINNVAWILATAPHWFLRDAARAVQLATHADQLSGGDNPRILRTLAAALAGQGDFPNAVQAANKALQLAEAQSNTRLADALRREVKLYQERRRYEGAVEGGN
jgi:tetratricopeptide (TPR) repeat protein